MVNGKATHEAPQNLSFYSGCGGYMCPGHRRIRLSWVCVYSMLLNHPRSFSWGKSRALLGGGCVCAALEVLCCQLFLLKAVSSCYSLDRCLHEQFAVNMRAGMERETTIETSICSQKPPRFLTILLHKHINPHQSACADVLTKEVFKETSICLERNF